MVTASRGCPIAAGRTGAMGELLPMMYRLRVHLPTRIHQAQG